MPLDFPSNPSDGQVYDDYYYDASIGAWQSNSGTQVPNIFKNVEYTTAQTYLTPVTVKGKVGQTADLQQWTDSAGNVLASIDEAGNMTVQSLTSIQPIVSVPTGAMMPYAGSTAPTLFLLCNGAAVSRTTYSALFSVIGTTYGAGDGSTTFNLPNPNGRVIAGKASSGTFLNLGATGGTETVTLDSTQIPSHTHPLSDHSHTYSGTTTTNGDHNHAPPVAVTYNGNAGNDRRIFTTNSGLWSAGDWYNATTTNGAHSHTFSGTTSGASTLTANGQSGTVGQAHSNLQPYLVTNYIIKT